MIKLATGNKQINCIVYLFKNLWSKKKDRANNTKMVNAFYTT